MTYKFPIINNISDVLPAIKGRKEFVVAQRDGYTIVNYNVVMIDTFPKVIDYNTAIRRECRGLIFCSETGNVLARRFHKFFNINEKEETQANGIDLSRKHHILEKLDGSMVTPFIVNGKLKWGTKMGETDTAEPVKKFVHNNPQYIEFSKRILWNGGTPIFEWCSRKQRIVIDYPEDRLVLTAIRDNRNGEYVSYPTINLLCDSNKLDCVRALPGSITNLQEFMDRARDLEGQEGYVIRFDDGHMLKIKGEWYLNIHHAKDAISFEKNVWALVLNNRLDDLKPDLFETDVTRLESFQIDLIDRVFKKASELEWLARAAYDNYNGSKKDFAIKVVNNPKQNFHSIAKGILFRLYDIDDWDREEAAINLVKESLLKHCKTASQLQLAREFLDPHLTFGDY